METIYNFITTIGLIGSFYTILFVLNCNRQSKKILAQKTSE